jgi:hypothetical protein
MIWIPEIHFHGINPSTGSLRGPPFESLPSRTSLRGPPFEDLRI